VFRLGLSSVLARLVRVEPYPLAWVGSGRVQARVILEVAGLGRVKPYPLAWVGLGQVGGLSLIP
jgi:hypothetical protein